jgi:hypothetical protein
MASMATAARKHDGAPPHFVTLPNLAARLSDVDARENRYQFALFGAERTARGFIDLFPKRPAGA